MLSIYNYRDYKTYLVDLSKEKGARSGFKSRLAEAARCNSAYISAVLGDKAHLSLEQAQNIGHHLELSNEESHFFLLLVQKARSGTSALANYFEKQLELVLQTKLNVQRRMGAKENLNPEDQARYYSSWMYAAIHVALSVPRLARSPETLAKYFEMPLARVREVLDFLVTTGLAQVHGQKYTIGQRHIHLGKNSNNILRHHSNWRLFALRALEESKEEDLNYSSAVVLSREDAYRVREILLSAVKKSVDLILDSPEEEIFALNLDFVSLGRGK